MVTVLLGGLGILTLYFAFYFFKDIYANRKDLGYGNGIVAVIIGMITNFFDTLGIGSFAPTTMLINFTKQLKNDKLLPGTLNVSCTIPVVAEAFIFITVVKVAPLTLISMVAAAIIGSFIGSKFVSKLPEQKVQCFIGYALVVTAVIMAVKQLGYLDVLGSGNTATAITGFKLIIGIVCNFILGALMTIGVGLYAPCMALVYLLGLSPRVAFPIMMASCAGLMPVASVNFIKEQTYSRKLSLGITIGGVIGVIIAAVFVKSLDLNVLTWLIIVVVVYTGITYILKSRKNK